MGPNFFNIHLGTQKSTKKSSQAIIYCLFPQSNHVLKKFLVFFFKIVFYFFNMLVLKINF
jgi:hypothetical protein